MAIRLSVYSQQVDDYDSNVAAYAQRHAVSQMILDNMKPDRIGQNHLASGYTTVKRPEIKGLMWCGFLKQAK